MSRGRRDLSFLALFFVDAEIEGEELAAELLMSSALPNDKQGVCACEAVQQGSSEMRCNVGKSPSSGTEDPEDSTFTSGAGVNMLKNNLRGDDSDKIRLLELLEEVDCCCFIRIKK
ncbi:unnamed protein product [Toxocara canis]|uniref:Uncharacterized protein n=1 Tax=Toxocara canis TaxID=6265 RepID=A0A183UV61_TOXCA|nr:unnamed protein product [Toxocara canis]